MHSREKYYTGGLKVTHMPIKRLPVLKSLFIFNKTTKNLSAKQLL
ncbi:hypothetical protein SAMN05216175_11195 [Neptunomonas qingdaonensis]|uniref:Uncharacterized protein n=1 Tax=Neptunomonas qingdaonensis TaxID=1045558 RepID=A0A1I2TYF9_9GAMM|nr:hypothetical protein SAMN05216175_11195 [Neptunomonas qingdaonensis]